VRPVRANYKKRGGNAAPQSPTESGDPSAVSSPQPPPGRTTAHADCCASCTVCQASLSRAERVDISALRFPSPIAVFQSGDAGFARRRRGSWRLSASALARLRPGPLCAAGGGEAVCRGWFQLLIERSEGVASGSWLEATTEWFVFEQPRHGAWPFVPRVVRSFPASFAFALRSGSERYRRVRYWIVLQPGARRARTHPIWSWTASPAAP
jgi:hypothetical protein